MPGEAHLKGSYAIGGRVLFRDLDLSLRPGEWTCLLGRSGIGKSTILRLFAGLETGGTFEGECQAPQGEAALMAQSDLLAPWLDVTGNVVLGARLRGETPDRARAEALIRRVGLEGHAHKRPRELSGGMRQRAALARTLMEDRPVVLLDEPFSALDAATRAECQELAFELLAGRTVLLVTHDPAEAARLGHRIHVLDRSGICDTRCPGEPPLRDPGAAATLGLQTDLLAVVRAA